MHSDWCVYAHSSVVSHHLGKKKYHSKVACQWRTTKAKARIWRLEGAENVCQSGSAAETLRWYRVRRWCPSCCVLILYKANVHCLTQRQKLTGRSSVRSLLEEVWNRKHLVKRSRGRNSLQTPMNPARNISAYAASLHVYFYLVGNLSWWAPSRRKEPRWSSARPEPLMLAQEMVGYKRWRHNQISEGSSKMLRSSRRG